MASGVASTTQEAAEAPVLKALVRSALEPISGSMSGRCAVVLLGLDPNTFDLAPSILREDAADIYGVSLERFRRDPQEAVLKIVAEAILQQCVLHRARLAKLAMEQRHPADTRLAIHWLERFEAYFRIWTPVYALGADLTAYRETLLEPGDVESDSDESLVLGYDDQEVQAAGYGTYALFHHVQALVAEERFISRFGGLWLLGSPSAEAEVRDALAASKRSLPMDERDHSWLRITFNAGSGEMHSFLEALRDDRIGMATHDDWQEWLQSCTCRWTAATHDTAVEYFPTARYHPGIDPQCLVHQTVEACGRFCALIEQEWMKVADWYGLST